MVPVKGDPFSAGTMLSYVPSFRITSVVGVEGLPLGVVRDPSHLPTMLSRLVAG